MTTDDSTDEPGATSRRTLLKTLGAGALAGIGATTAAAADGVTPQDCYTEYDCTGERCKYGGGYQRYSRRCCNYGDGYHCDSWEDAGCC